MSYTNPYKLGKLEELLQFDKDCYLAASDCPQFNNKSNISDILSGKMSVQEVVDCWQHNEELWRYGYGINLSSRAVDTFNYIIDNGKNGLRKLCNEIYT